MKCNQPISLTFILVDFSPLAEPSTALISLTIINIWQFTPFYMLMILAALQLLDPELNEAAEVDGASSLQRIFYITIPQIRDVLLTLALFDLVTTAAYFTLVWTTTQGGPMRTTEVLATYVYRNAFLTLNWNVAAAAGMILLFLCIVVTVILVSQMEQD